MDFPISVPSIGLVDGKFADEDPLAGTPGSLIPAQWGNGITLEVLNVIEAAGIAPSEVENDQLLQALTSMIGLAKGHGQCRLAVVGPTSLKLSPYNGNNLIINGVPQQIPSAGITISNAGLAASTVYYIYAWMNGGVMTLESSTTGHTPNTNGIELKTGDATRTLVGMIRTNASLQFVFSQQQRFCLNWFNRRAISALNRFAVNRVTTSATPVELSSSERAEFLSWGDESAMLSFSASAYQNTTSNSFSSSVSLDGVLSNAGTMVVNVTTNNIPQSVTSIAAFDPTEGYHYATVLGAATAGFTAIWLGSYATITAMTRG